MATYRFGNGRSIARKYAFKFNVKATLFSSPFSLGQDTNTWQLFTFSVGAEVIFVSLNADNFRGFTPSITNGQLGENSGPANFFYDANLGKYFIPFIYTVKGLEGTNKFYLEEFGGPDKNDPDIETIRAGQDPNLRRYRKIISGTQRKSAIGLKVATKTTEQVAR